MHDAEQRMRDRVRALEAQVDELQARGSALENERRAWKARATATREILESLAIETPVLLRMMGQGVTTADVHDIAATALDLSMRMEVLERDVWTRCSIIARELVSAFDHGDVSATPEMRAWVYRFRAALEAAT